MTIPFPHPHRHHLHVHMPRVPLVAILVVAAAPAALAFVLVDDHPWAPASSGVKVHQLVRGATLHPRSAVELQSPVEPPVNVHGRGPRRTH